MKHSIKTAYIVGVALGDGNLSNPNGRAVRLRITCDNKYPKLIIETAKTLQDIFPNNKVSLINRKDNCTDISIYTNKLELLLPWSHSSGSKYDQNVQVPQWIINDTNFSKSCLRGLIVTDGSIYKDRGYLMVNFATNIKLLADDVVNMINEIGFKPTISSTQQPSGKPKYTVRVSKNSKEFLKEIKLNKKA